MCVCTSTIDSDDSIVSERNIKDEHCDLVQKVRVDGTKSSNSSHNEQKLQQEHTTNSLVSIH